MAGLPVFAGAVQETSRLVVEAAETRGRAGAAGGSATSVRVMVTATVSLPPLPSSTLMVTE